jgi:phosphopantothenoylcysteine decarboxylase / phosphopantothenate---cysteine ligase
VTAGPTREAIDPVRFISNSSSGKMGVAIAEAAWERGAEVSLIAGPLTVRTPVGPRHVAVRTVDEMRVALEAELPAADVLVMAAAPADFRPAVAAQNKVKRGSGALTLAMQPTDDILLSTSHARNGRMVVVGFALETESLVENARAKLESKSLDLIVANDACEPGAGFDVDTNRVTFIAKDATPEQLPLMSKRAVAEALLDRVEALVERR